MSSDRLRLRLYLIVFIGLLLCGIIGFGLSENLSPVDAAYFSIVTMATVGYGDIHPQTSVGKILAMVLIIGGVGTFLGVVASITDLFFNRREQGFRHQKINMMAGVFFSELGNGLLRRLVPLDSSFNALSQILQVTDQWEKADFSNAEKHVDAHNFSINILQENLSELHAYLQEKTSLLLSMLENPILQEHSHFTDLILAVFHLRDELGNREDLSTLTQIDQRHLEGDIQRIYKLLVVEWLSYMHHLKNNYPYLLSLAMRTNPFNPKAKAAVQA